jgi:peptidoglycan-associated lipoprotein
MFTEERMERRSIALVAMAAAFALVLGSAGCQQTAPTKSTADTTGGTAGQDFQPDTGEIEPVETVELTELKTIYFDYDKSAIRADQRSSLKADGDGIRAQEALGVVTLHGNCDERGSEEYNLALGERRATSVKKYLVDLGVPSSRLRTVSFGESKPAVAGHDESAWKWNRRVDFATNR